MNILELDSFSLDDAVKFHTRLNPRIWGKDEHLLPEVKQKLLAIAQDFQEFLGVPALDVKDITISGSNAAYTYTPHSDIDLHLVVAMPESHNEVYQELFNAKKYQYNDEHNIVIGGADVELYVQLSDKSPVSQGEYSVLNDQWIQVPRRRKHSIDDTCVRAKVEDLDARIQQAIDSGDADRMNSLWTKIKTMRQTGLDQHGEFGCENITFKILRKHGVLKNLKTALNAARDQELSLAERNQPRVKKVWGFSEGHQGQPYSSEDGVAPSTQMFLNEEPDTESIINQFIQHTADRLGIESMPKVNIHRDPDWSIENHSFGQFRPDTNELDITVPGRHLLDILRTVAHELTHCRQNELEQLPLEAGETGSHWENEAHAAAGIIMRDFAEAHPGLFDSADLQESASGYIPKNKKEAAMPQYAMALSVDIKPGQVGKEANKLALNTGRNGEPTLLMKSANLQESRMPQPSQGPGKYRDLNEPLGPESPPKMPAGTIKVDVSDTQDWYQLGQDISNLKLANKSHYNQGPPHTVLAFGSEELENMYSKQLKSLGLPTHDLDEPGEEDEDLDEELSVNHLHKELAEEFELLEQEFLGEVKMTGKNLAALAKNIKDVKVGLEFEMIVPNVTGDEDDYNDMEPDYDQDERVRDIDDAVQFFDDGDYNTSRDIRSLRESMSEDYYNWQYEQIENEWDKNGFEFFQEYLDREEPFDPEDYKERAVDEIKAEFPEMPPESEGFEELVDEKLREINAEYYTESWEAQGRNYDHAREEFEEEQRDNYSEQDWLENQGIRYASDVESNYDVRWPYYSSNRDGNAEDDIQNVALDFMNAMGMDSVAISDSYHGSYKKWVGNGWVSIGSSKPDDCFTIEPDGSLEGDDDSDRGLEFVSPPIPLEDIGTVMKKVQSWAGTYGAYTGKDNKTSIHTNISVPGYDLDKLDYVKAALLLGDEYVLREFDRIGNTYAAPAIEKVRQLVKQNPDKAKTLLDKMKSQLNAEASKLIHSGQTNKFTSINTKDNRIEFRSPGGDYLSIIADNPQKMIDTINRMVVTMDAAMDPDKYKEEYQKKLYKMLTGQQSGREAASGKKQEMKKDDKDLLNIFSRYAAGELPKAALKSFVRQAQLQRKVAKGEDQGKMWWRVGRPGYGASAEVVASNKEEAIALGKKEYPDWANAQDMTATPLRPYKEETKGPTLNGRPSNPDGNYVIVDANNDDKPVYRYMASNNNDSLLVLRQWITANPGTQWTFKYDPDQTLDQPGDTQSSQQQGNWGIWIDANNRFANQPGSYARDETPPLIRFPSRGAAEQWIEQQRAARPNLRTDIDVREIPPRLLPGSTLDLQRQRAAQAQEIPEIPLDIEIAPLRAAQQGVDTTVPYELYNRTTGAVIDTFPARNDDEARVRLDDYRDHGDHGQPQHIATQLYGVRRGPGVTNAQTDTNPLRPTGPGPWEVANRNNNQVYYNPGHQTRMAAQAEAERWLRDNGHNPNDFEVRTRETASNRDAAQGGLIDVAPRTLTRPGQGQQVFTGQWKILVNGQEVHRFGGIGNNQGDANRIAAAWLRNNGMGVSGEGFEVYPVMGEA
jgi:hypothetical protein